MSTYCRYLASSCDIVDASQRERILVQMDLMLYGNSYVVFQGVFSPPHNFSSLQTAHKDPSISTNQLIHRHCVSLLSSHSAEIRRTPENQSDLRKHCRVTLNPVLTIPAMIPFSVTEPQPRLCCTKLDILLIIPSCFKNPPKFVLFTKCSLFTYAWYISNDRGFVAVYKAGF